MNNKLQLKADEFYKKYQNETKLFMLFLCLVVVMALLSPNRFFNAANIKNVAFQIPEFCLLSLAMMVVIVTGGINLSITSTAAVAQIAIAMVMTSLAKAGVNENMAIALGLLAGLAASVACGLVNGMLVAHLHVNPMMATLGTMMLYEGIALRVTNGSSITGFPEAYQVFGAGSLLGLPIPILVLALAIIVVYFLLERTAWGEHMYFCGCNYTATTYSGVRVKQTLIKAYVLSGVLSMLAAVLMTSRYNSAKVDYGSSYLMMAIAAVLLGGTDITGGYGRVMGTVIGVAIIQVVSNGLNILGTNRYLVNVVTGAILLMVLTMKYFSDIQKSKAFYKKKRQEE